MVSRDCPYWILFAIGFSISLLAGSDDRNKASKEGSETSETKAEFISPAKLPSYHNLRFAEDWSVLHQQTEEGEGWQRLKYIPLSHNGDVYFSLGGQLRFRGELWDNFGFSDVRKREDGFGLFRLRLHGDLILGRSFRVFVEGKSSLANGRELPGGNRAIDTDSMALQNAFVDFRVPLEGDKTLTFRAGRQELQFGKQRFVSPLDWANTRRTFDGFRGIYRWSSWRIESFWVRPTKVSKYGFNRPDPASEFLGVYSSGRLPGSELSLDVYWLRLERDRATFGGVTGPEIRQTAGGRVGGVLKGNFGVDLEAAYQFGSHGERDIRAFMFAGQTAYQFPTQGTPRIYAGFDYASGDEDPDDNQVNTLNQLFPLAHAYNGFIDMVARQNIIDFSQGISFKPWRRITAKVDGHFFWRASRADALYNAGAGVVRAGDLGDSRWVGSELDLTTIIKIDRHLTLVLGYSRFFPGAFVEESGPSENIQFGYLAIQYTF